VSGFSAGPSITVEVPEPREPPRAEVFLLEAMRRARRQRQERSAGTTRSSHKRRAVMTMVHNEPVFFPIWLRYYSRFFGRDDIYVLDHDTTDGSTERDGFVRIPVSHESVDHTWMVRTIEAHQRELFEGYDVVLVTDVDEIVAPRPEWGTLADYIDDFDDEFVTCLGYELIHLVDREGPFDPSRGVLDQRGHWFRSTAYDKPALTTQPTRWTPGFHSREDGRTDFDPDLCMVHLHRMDYEICLARHRHRRELSWNERDLAQRWARHNLIVDEAEFARWFYEDNSYNDRELAVQPIPASWRGLF
jgi:Glycosyl transferase family 2